MDPLLEYLSKRSSTRMKAICHVLMPGRPIWDLCCDHGMIGLLAYSQGGFPALHLLDRAKSVMENLRQNLLSFPPRNPEQVYTYCQDAMSVHVPSTQSNIILAGIGSKAIVRILQNLLPRLRGDHRFVLSTQSQLSFLESFILERNELSLKRSFDLIERGRNRRIYVLDFARPIP